MREYSPLGSRRRDAPAPCRQPSLLLGARGGRVLRDADPARQIGAGTSGSRRERDAMVPESADAPLRTTLRLVRETYAAWNRRDGWLYAAAMAAFAALALAPLFVITLRVSEIVGGRPAVVHALAIVITPVAGHGAVRSLEATTTQQNGSTIATVLSVLIAVFAGSRLFYAMQRALHRIWQT